MKEANGASEAYRFGDWLVEPALNLLSRDTGEHRLEPLAMDVLAYLLERPQRVVTNDELLDALWSDRAGDPSMIKKRVAQIRAALADDARNPKYIETIRQRGYRTIAPVASVAQTRARQAEPLADRVAVQTTPAAAKLKKLAGPGITLMIALIGIVALFVGISDRHPPEVRAYDSLTRAEVSFPPVPSRFPLVNDGSTIHFNDWVAGRLGLRRLARVGGDAVQISSPFDDPETLINPLGLTPDGAGLLIMTFTPTMKTDASLWHWPILGGTPRRIGSGSAAAYTPDGKQMFFAKMRQELFLANADMSEPQPLGVSPGATFWPSFSPDGTTLRVSVDDGQRSGIYEVPLDGSGLRPFLPEWDGVEHCCGSWTPDGLYYVFQATHQHNTQLWALREKPGIWSGNPEPVQITRTAMQFRRPTVSKDGSKIFAVGWNLHGELMMRKSQTGRYEPVPGLENVSAEMVDFTRDGDWAVYVSYPDAALWRVKRDGTRRLRLTDPGTQAAHPAWSPDGRQIAYLAAGSSSHWRLALVSADGEPLRTTEFQGRISKPTWSPDGATIALHVATPNGGGVWFTDTQSGKTQPIEHLQGLWEPRWSPDGRYMAGVAEGQLNIVDLSTEVRSTLLPAPYSRWHRWAQDSQSLFVVDPFWQADKRAVTQVSIVGGAEPKVTYLGDIKGAFGVAGSWIGVTNNGEPMILRDLSIHNIYALDWLPR